MSFYEVKVVNKFGTVLATFNADEGDGDTRQKVTVESVTWALNEPGSLVFSLSTFHPKAPQIVAVKTEVQLWRNGAMIFWGVPVQAQLSGATLTWTCPGLLWYFTRLYFGPPNTQYLLNPRFETNLASWTAVGCTAAHSTAVKLRGPGTARLVSTSSGDNYLWQTVVRSTGVTGHYYTLAGWLFIDPAVAFTETAFEEAGLYIQAPNGGADPDSVTGDPLWEPITNNAEVGKPTRLEKTIFLAPNLTNQTMTIRLYSPHGAVHWGATSLTENESIGADQINGSDATEVMRLYASYATVQKYAQIGYGNTLNIATDTVDCPASGVNTLELQYLYDPANVYDSLTAFPDRGIADFEIVCTSTTRKFKTFAPKKGTLKSGYPVTVPGSGVISLDYNTDGQQTATRVIRRAPGDGADREVGVAADVTLTDGLVLEDLGDIPVDMLLSDLDGYAATSLAETARIVTIPNATVAAAGFLGNVEVGDTVPVSINWGAVQDVANRRIVQMTLDAKSDTLALGMAK